MSVFSRSTYRKVSLIKCLISARFSLYSLSSFVGNQASFEIPFHAHHCPFLKHLFLYRSYRVTTLSCFCAIVSSFFSYDYHFWQFVKIIVFLNMRIFNITFVVDRLEWDFLFNGKTCIIQVHIFLERDMSIKYCSLVMSFLFNLKSEHNYDSQLFYS